MRFALLLALAGCGDKSPDDTAAVADDSGEPSEAVDPLDWPLSGSGPYNVGYALAQTTYTTALGASHTIDVHVFYPTEDTTGEAVRYASLFPDERALGGAAAAAPVRAEGYPVLVHSHGHFGVAGAVDYWAHRLVSHGWVVAAPDHVGNTFAAGFPDFSEPSPTAHYIARPQDASAALDLVIDGAMLAGPVDLDRVGLSGHSRGAYTVWAAAGGTFDAEAIAAGCAGETGAFDTRTCTEAEAAVFLSGELHDPRFQASVLLDGSIRRELFGDDGHASATTPFIALTREGEGPQAQYDTSEPLDFTWVPVEGSCHETFNLGIEAATRQPCDTFDPDRGWDLTATYTLAFLRHHLQGDDREDTVAILDGTTTVDAAATVHHH